MTAPPAIPSSPPAPPAAGRETVGAIGAATSPVAAADGRLALKSRTIYLPPGFMKARLLTGIDAGEPRRDQQPEPMIARVQAPAVLPNDVKANLAGCFVIGNATGASPRAGGDPARLALLRRLRRTLGGRSADQGLLRRYRRQEGPVRQGRHACRRGARACLHRRHHHRHRRSVENTAGDVSTSALGSVRSFDAGDAAKAGVAGGLARSSEKLTDFYLDLARQAGPIVEVGAAKDVVVVIQEGVTLEIKPTAGAKF
jgi:conjugal transfer pilus assembly protein TraB